LFKNNFDISKPIILSITEAFLIITFIIIFIVDILQLTFAIPLIDILENDIDRQFYDLMPDSNPNNSDTDENTDTDKTENCMNINKFKDPQAIHSFYNLQMNNYKSMKDYFTKITQIKTPPPPLSLSQSQPHYKPYLDNPFVNGIPNNFDSIMNIPKTQLDYDMDAKIKYWLDNSSSILQKNK